METAGFVAVNGVELFVRSFGRGRPLVVVHGGPDWDHSYLLPAVAPLADALRVTLYDQRGCGRSERTGDPASYSLDAAADDLASLLGALRLESPVLLGFSWGGRVVLRFVARHPGWAGRVILASTTAYTEYRAELDASPEYRSRQAAIRDEQGALFASTALEPEELTRRLAELTLPLNVGDLACLSAAREVIAGVRWSGEWMRALRAGRLSGVAHPDYAEVLRRAALPTLIVHGQQDLVFPVGVARRLRAAYPGAQLRELPGAGHLAFVEAGEAWRGAVRAFAVS